MAETYRPSKGVQDEARWALAQLTLPDEARIVAERLTSGEPMTADAVVLMYLRLSTGELSDRLNRAAWGGDAGLSWSSRIHDQLAARTAILEEATNMAITTLEQAEHRAAPVDQPLADSLGVLLNEVFAFYARAHEAHWNVTGTDFAEYHDLFANIYGDVYESVDPIAENIRKLGSLAPCLMVEHRDMVNVDASALAAELLAGNEELLYCIRSAFDIANATGQQGVANFLAERMDAHQKWSWQLRASLGIAVVGSDSPVVVEDAEDELTDMDAADMAMSRSAIIEACEKRTMTAEIRAMGDESNRIGGYAVMWDREADGLPFREVIRPGAFTRSLSQGDDVFLLVNHDADSLPLARRSSGTLTVSEDQVGLRFEADLDSANPDAMSLLSAVRRGDVDKCSFAFTVADNGSTRNKDGLRELTDLNLFEVSVVTWPAYSSTSVGMRTAQADDDLGLRARFLAAKQRQLSL